MKCNHCGKNKWIKYSLVERGGGKYCSYQCRCASENWKNQIRKSNQARKRKLLSVKAKNKIGNGVKHSLKYQKSLENRKPRNQTGAKNSMWKGGITSENHKVRGSIKMRLWREAVFARDNYTCQKCEAKTGNGKRVYLHPHHIFNFAQFINFRFEVFNGITFCKKCHKEFHKIYGTTNNNREQVNEFLV